MGTQPRRNAMGSTVTNPWDCREGHYKGAVAILPMPLRVPPRMFSLHSVYYRHLSSTVQSISLNPQVGMELEVFNMAVTLSKRLSVRALPRSHSPCLAVPMPTGCIHLSRLAI